MPKIIVKKLPNSEATPSKSEILKVLFDCGVQVSGVRLSDDKFHVFCCEDGDSDRLFAEACITALQTLNCEPVLPPHIRAKRTVLLRNLDQLVYDNEVDDIKLEIGRANRNLIVDDIFKFQNNKMIKVTFSSHKMALECTESGMYMFSLRIPPRNIELDEFIEVKVCYRCYKLEKHTSETCEQQPDYKICSLCSVVGHTYKNCTATMKKCINCGGSHSALAMSCPERKKIVNSKRNNKKTYAERVAGRFNPGLSYNSSAIPDQHNYAKTATGELTNFHEVIQKSALCLMIASLKENENEGCFGDVLNTLLSANGLTEFNMSTVTPPKFGSQMLDTHSVPDRIAKKSSNVDDAAAVLDSLSVGGSQESDSSSEVSVDHQVVASESSAPLISIFKKRGVPKLTAINIDKMIAEKKIVIETEMNANDCLKCLKSDLGLANITEVPATVFNGKLNSKGRVIRDASVISTVNT